jgi:hypothetical protein
MVMCGARYCHSNACNTLQFSKQSFFYSFMLCCCLTFQTKKKIIVFFQFRQRRKSTRTSERENTVRHLIQMMAIAEIKEGEEEDEENKSEEEEGERIADEWAALHRDDRSAGSLKVFLSDLV